MANFVVNHKWFTAWPRRYDLSNVVKLPIFDEIFQFLHRQFQVQGRKRSVQPVDTREILRPTSNDANITRNKPLSDTLIVHVTKADTPVLVRKCVLFLLV